MKRSVIVIVVLFGIPLVGSACGNSSAETTETEHEDEHVEDEHMEGEDEHEDEHMEGEDEHMEDDMDHMHVDPPVEFADLTNPFGGDADAKVAGQEIFNTNCATCHGAEGAGDGEGAVGLDPKPANLGDHEMMEMLSDGYLFWRVSTGGAQDPFNSAMPTWENSLTEEQRWQVISYVRSFTEE